MSDSTETTTTETPELGDAGTKAIKAERDRAKAAEARATAAEARVVELETAEVRRSVAAAKGLTADQAKYLQGADADAMNAHADELLAAFAPASEEETATSTRSTPVERLRPGTIPGAEREPSMADVAANVLGG